MQRWFPPSIHEIVRTASRPPDSGCGDASLTATSQWRGALAALAQLLRSQSHNLSPMPELGGDWRNDWCNDWRNDRDSAQDSVRDSDGNSARDNRWVIDRGNDWRSDWDDERGSDRGSDWEDERGSDQISDQISDRGKERDQDRGSEQSDGDHRWDNRWDNRWGGDRDKDAAAVAAAEPVQGMILTGPVPVFTQTPWLSHWLTWTCSPQKLGTLWQLPPAGARMPPPPPAHAPQGIALLPGDPLAQEAFCLVLSAQFGVVLTLEGGAGNGEGRGSFHFSFDPKVVWQAWQTLRARVAIAQPAELPRLDALAAQFVPVEPHYSVVMEFGQWLLATLPADVAPAPPVRTARRSQGLALRQHRTLSNPRDHKLDASVLAAAQRRVEPNPKPGRSGLWNHPAARSGDVGAVGADIELLQALSHGVRTPLATIRTLTRLLMKRRDMQPDVLRHLEKIDRECTDQIDRFDLIFRAVELETGSSPAPSQSLAPISLGQLFQTNIPRWQRQAERHNLTIDVQVPQKLPAVASDPAVLDRILTELVENLARNLPAGSHLEMQVLPVGDRLKLQLRCQRPDCETHPPVAMDYDELLAQGMSGILTGLGEAVASSVSVGQLLTFQPETGNLSLNLNVTKNLFQAIGGKLVVRQRPRQGEFATIFLPLALKI